MQPFRFLRPDVFYAMSLFQILNYFQTPRTESFKISRTENKSFLEDGKVELESTVSMTLQQKSILHDVKSAGGTASTSSVSSSGIQTPKLSSSIRFDGNNSTIIDEDNNEASGESFQFPAPPLPIEVRYLI